MRTLRVVPVPIALLIAAACAGRASSPPPLDPVGNYEFATSVDGQSIDGTFDIAGRPGAYTGTIRVQGMAPIPITSVTVQGQSLRIAAAMDGQNVAINLSFTGDTFTGAWSAGEMGGSPSGRRIR